jgi:NAD(P)H dehydrogenase (quinone)
VSIVITGASGQLGRLVTTRLVERGVAPADLVLVTRTPAALAEDAPAGADIRAGDFDDPASLRAAFAGGERLLLISTDAVGRRVDQHRNAIDAAVAAGVRHVAYTSMGSPGAENPAAVAREHGPTEDALRACGLAWTALRNGLYAEFQVPEVANALASGRLVHNRGDGRTAYVSRDDCAAAAAAVLATDGHENTAYDITGPELFSAADVAALASELGGKPVEAVNVDDDALRGGLVSAGLPDGMADVLVTFGRAIREGHLAQLTDAVEQLTGRPPRSLRDVLAAHADAFAPAA